MPAATVKLAIDPASSYPKELKKKLARQRRARICWNAR
jgi:hypothetical protein